MFFFVFFVRGVWLLLRAVLCVGCRCWYFSPLVWVIVLRWVWVFALWSVFCWFRGVLVLVCWCVRLRCVLFLACL